MPGIDQKRREEFSPVSTARNVGELTYLLTETIRRYWVESSRRYQNIAEILGALWCTQEEFYRFIVRPYEDQKYEENGHVWK